MDNFDQKFGALPPPSALAPPTPAHVVLLGQMVVCAALLLAVQPPFVMVTGDGGVPTVCVSRVLACCVATAMGTYLMHACGAAPGDTFRGAFEVLHRSLR